MRQALRALSRDKAFAAFATLTLALGVGSVTAIFSVLDSVLLKPLAYRAPDRLYAAAEGAADRPDETAQHRARSHRAPHFRSARTAPSFAEIRVQ